jgi:hypothetical protein
MKAISAAILFILLAAPAGGAGVEHAVFPTVNYDRHIVYQSLTLFWLGILGILVIIRMKLKEVERVQKMALDEPKNHIPCLD